MSYRNPKQVVDTQSGQHVRNMLQQISGATVGALNQIKKEADKKREEIANIDKSISLEPYKNAVKACENIMDTHWFLSKEIYRWVFKGIKTSKNIKGITISNPFDLTFLSVIKSIPDKLLPSRACFRFNLIIQRYVWNLIRKNHY